MPNLQRRFSSLEFRVYLLLALVIAVAAAARYIQYLAYSNYFTTTYGYNLGLDRIGESYHRWVMDMLTLKSGVYSDFQPQPNQAIYWLPFYNSLTIAAMFVTQSFSVATSRIISVIAGIITPAVVFLAARRLYGNFWHSVIAGFVAATLPWYVDYSLWGVPYVLLGFLISLAVYAFVTERPVLFGIAGALAVATGYEAWILIFTIAILAYTFRGWVGRKALQAVGPSLIVILAWVAWSTIATGNPAAWILRYLAVLGWQPTFNPAEADLYMMQLFVPTFFIGLVAVLWGFYKGQQTRILAIALLALAAVATLFHVAALDIGSPARLLPAYPIIAALFPPVFPRFKGGLPRKTLLISIFLIWLILPQYAIVNQEHGPLTGKAYILVPEYRTGDALNKTYHGGRIISDSPTVMYYSGLNPSLFISSRAIAWYETEPDNSKLVGWLQSNNVSLVVWEKSTSSELWHIFPDFDDGQIHKLGPALLIPIYEDTIVKRHQIQQQNGTALWEHDFPGTPELVIYQVQFISVL